MFIFELISTLTFQLRIKLTSIFEKTKEPKLQFIIPIVAVFSWLVAGFQGVLFINNNENIYTFLLKIPPISFATFLGVFLNLNQK